MTHHKQNIPLPQMVKGYALRDDTENKFMCNLTATLLSGMLRIAVENSARTSPNSVYAIATESVNLLFLSVNMIWNRRQYCSCSRALYNHSNLYSKPCSVPVSQEYQHEFGTAEKYRIDLHEGDIRIDCCVLKKIFLGSSEIALFIYPYRRFLPAHLERTFLGKSISPRNRRPVSI